MDVDTWDGLARNHARSHDRAGRWTPENFLRLRDAPASQILRYAQRWGVLGLCEHDFPAQHPPDYWPSRAIEAHACPYAYDDPYGFGPLHSATGRPRRARRSKRAGRTWIYRRADFHTCHVRGIYEIGWYVGKPWEPVDAWRTWARRAHALLAVAAALQQEKLGAEPDWRMATDTEMETPETPPEGWRLLTYYADYWLRAADVRPWPQFQDGKVRFTLGSDWGHSPLFGAIAVQLVLAISGFRGLLSAMRAETCMRLYALLVPANVTIARLAAIERCLNDMRRRGIGRGKRKSAARANCSALVSASGMVETPRLAGEE